VTCPVTPTRNPPSQMVQHQPTTRSLYLSMSAAWMCPSWAAEPLSEQHGAGAAGLGTRVAPDERGARGARHAARSAAGLWGAGADRWLTDGERSLSFEVSTV
jgi:hypothetical protein